MPSPGIILFKKELGDELSLDGAKNYHISGAGRGRESYAMRAESQKLVVGDVFFLISPYLSCRTTPFAVSPRTV